MNLHVLLFKIVFSTNLHYITAVYTNNLWIIEQQNHDLERSELDTHEWDTSYLATIFTDFTVIFTNYIVTLKFS